MPGPGRPREFDRTSALDAAVRVFWRQGYEGTSLRDLTAAMGIGRPSLYAAFGGKEQLFRAVVARYRETEMAYVRAALDRPTAHEVAEALLHGQLDALRRPGLPAGCLSVQGAAAVSAGNAGVAEFLAAGRLAGEAALAERFARAVDEGDLPPGTDPAALARFLQVVLEGQAVHAAAGVGSADLARSAELALRAVPAGGRRRRAPR
ncbi:TetR family transcriptional regulator [Kineococcus sp. R8]|uniref:TetR family transcriptional regulator n=1 Tax=Kineococcus siccus TaxID=2696567 RepID=UPI0014132620|nr:TetR family transcriptional regulator [Kineococcus siccus]